MPVAPKTHFPFNKAEATEQFASNNSIQNEAVANPPFSHVFECADVLNSSLRGFDNVDLRRDQNLWAFWLLLLVITFSSSFAYGDQLAVATSQQNDAKDKLLRFPKRFLFMPDKGDENSSMIVQINLGRIYMLESAATCYRERDKIFLSLSEFAKAVEFPIVVSDDLSGASGWFIEEKRLFTLNFNAELLLVNGKRFAFSPENIKIIDNEIFFEIGFLQQIFPLKLTFDQFEQVIELVSLDPLPIELTMERNRKWEEFRNEQDLEKKNNDESQIKTIKSPYKAASSPVVDLRLNQGFKKFQNAKNQRSTNLNALIGGDFLYLNHQLFINSTESKINTARLTSGQKDAQGGLAGPLKATEFQIGDVNSPQNFLVTRGGQIGKGVSITNYPEEYVSGFDQILVRGNMQAGWDVELYRNDQLLFFEKVSASGIYEFQNVPLVAGANIIKLVFYGPFGQKREEIRRYFTNEGLIKSSKLYYRLSASKNNETLFNIKNNQIDQAKDPRDGKNRYYAEIAYGLNDSTSIISDFIRIPIDDNGKSRSYNSSSIRSAFFGIYADFNIARHLESGANAFQTSAQAKIFEQSLTLKNLRYDKNFVSEQQQKTIDPLLDSSSIRIDGPVGKISSGLLNSLSISRNQFFSKNYRLDLQNDFSATITTKFSLGQNLRYVSDSRVSGADSIAKTGRTLFNYRISRPLMLRSSVSYEFSPKKSLNSASSSIDYSLENTGMINFGHNYQFPQAGKSGATNYVVSLSRPFKSIIASASGSFNDDDRSYGLNLNLSMSIGYDMRYKTGLVSGAPLANSGIISARIFIDQNNNGRLDQGEAGLENVRILIDEKPSQNRSDANGVLILGQVPTSNPVKIKVYTDDISNPALIVKKPAFKILVHSGTITNIDFPVVSTGEISGMVRATQNNKTDFASSVHLELLDEDNNLVKETVSAFDGYYIFDSVPLGTYKIRISPSQMARLNMKTDVADHSITVSEPEQEVKLDFAVEIGGFKEEQLQIANESQKIDKAVNQIDNLQPADNSIETNKQSLAKTAEELVNSKITHKQKSSNFRQKKSKNRKIVKRYKRRLKS